MNSAHLLAEVAAFYLARPREQSGASPEVHAIRFEQLAKVGELARADSVGDCGCGDGALLGYLRGRGFAGEYRGFDVAEAMVATARQRHAADPRARFATDENVLGAPDYVLASGIFNVKLATPTSDWEAHLRLTLDRIAARSPRGFAFNMLTNYCEPAKRRPECYYADPSRLFDLCKRRYSRHVSLLHDYGLDEFTILVRR